MPLHSLYFLPHGGVIIPGLEKKRPKSSDNLHNSMIDIGKEIKQDKIDLILITSPHGYTHPNDYLFYLHDIYEGWHYYQGLKSENPKIEQLIFVGNTSISQIFLQSFQQTGLPANPIILGDTSYPLKLSWGETIPLSYISSRDGPQVVAFTVPMRLSLSYNSSKEILDELKGVGQLISRICNVEVFKDINIAFVASGDLSHTHDPNHQYGYHENSEKFDTKSVDWTKNPSNDKVLELIDLNQTAEACGIHSLGIIQGVLDFEESIWKNSTCIYECPTYFGMMVSSWKKK